MTDHDLAERLSVALKSMERGEVDVVGVEVSGQRAIIARDETAALSIPADWRLPVFTLDELRCLASADPDTTAEGLDRLFDAKTAAAGAALN